MLEIEGNEVLSFRDKKKFFEKEIKMQSDEEKQPKPREFGSKKLFSENFI